MQLRDASLFKQECLVDGKWISSGGKESIPVTNPANNEQIGSVPKLGWRETAEAITAAERAWPAWKALTGTERGRFLRRWHALILENIDDLAMILTTEQGKPLAEAKGELQSGLSYIEWYAEEAKRGYGEVIPSPWQGKQPLTVRQPVGVAAAITPWNFPMSMIARKAAPALAAGCPIVIKPASMTPYSALAMGELALRAGIPAGVLNVITGDSSEIGGEMCRNPELRKLSFTGSTEVGKKLLAGCAETVKKVSMELGGNAPMIICPDADLDQAATGVLASKFRNAGQTCICTNRLIVHADIHDALVERVVEKAKKIVVGNGIDPGVTMGPLINRNAFEEQQEFVDDAVAKGAKVALGGKAHEKGGLFYEPTVLTDVTTGMRAFREEIFGPVLPVMRYESEAEAVSLANDTEYGLACYVFTRDIGSFYRLSRELEFGMVGVNETTLAGGEVPFGGVKYSGLGREGGKQGLDEYLETKYILLGGLS